MSSLKKHKVVDQPNGAAIAHIMERMSARNSLSGIRGPAAWQREIRRDRPLPGREGRTK